MFKPYLVINREIYNQVNIKKTPPELYEVAEVLIPVNPFYIWLEENINNISYKLLKGFISNIVPLGIAGRNYFERIVEEKCGLSDELMCLYSRLDKMYTEGNVKIKSYLELQYLGYTGEFLEERYPVDDIRNILDRTMVP